MLAEMYRYEWAIDSRWLELALADHAAGRVAKRAAKTDRTEHGVAIIPIQGMITPRGTIFDDIFGGTAAANIELSVKRAMADDSVRAIVLDIDSPGGITAGIETAADRVREASQVKPVWSIANHQAASAAYWIGSQANRFYAMPGAEVGSIGVYRMHMDHSQQLADDGVRPTIIRYPANKAEDNPYEPLSEDAIAHHSEQVRATYEVFAKAVARGRNVSAEEVETRFGAGRSFGAKQAAQLGLVDSVANAEGVMHELASRLKARGLIARARSYQCREG